MRLKRLLTNQEFEKFQKFQKNSELVLENCRHTYKYYGIQGYKSELSENTQKELSEIEKILKDIIEDFVSFFNFTEDNRIRFQYYWSWHFCGVGYITLEELKGGFNVNLC